MTNTFVKTVQYVSYVSTQQTMVRKRAFVKPRGGLFLFPNMSSGIRQFPPDGRDDN